MTELDTNGVSIETQPDDLLDTDLPNDESEEITIEDYNKLKRSFEKAGTRWVEPTKAFLKEMGVSTLQELKDKIKETKQDNFVTREDLEFRDFLSNNPDMKSYESDLKDYTKKGISFEEAKILIQNKDKSIENKKKLETIALSHDEGGGGGIKSKYTKDELAKLDPSTYNKVAEKVRKGEIIVS